MDLSDLIQPGAIIPALKASSKKQLLQILSEKAAELTGLPEREVFETILQRERLGSTGVGNGVAIPHGRHASVKKAVGAFIRTQEPVAFDAPDGKPVSLLFILLVPENATGEHLEVLSQLAGKFSAKHVREALMAAGDAEEARRILVEE